MTLFLCAGNGEVWDFAKSIGVGLVSSAMNLTKILVRNSSFEKVIFVGTCGLYKKGEIFDIIKSKTAVNIEISELLGLSYSPLNCDVPHETKINSSNFITTDKSVASKFYERGLVAENMEFFSVYKVAKSFGIPVFGVFCATNFCDENAHNDFIKNHKKAMDILENYIIKTYFSENRLADFPVK